MIHKLKDKQVTHLNMLLILVMHVTPTHMSTNHAQTRITKELQELQNRDNK